ncbi:MAG: TIGR04283 family arsenosugar biosynthesis glycosyltransferase [Chthoniobacterales bacterium]
MPEELHRSLPPLVSIIVPVLDEAELIRDFLQDLRRRAAGAEIIVVDGGSEDDTMVLSAGLADTVLKTERGRARQMNAGTAIARGNLFWFLHADAIVPANALNHIADALRDDALVGGCFRLRFPRRECIYRFSDSLGNVGVELAGLALGDHGIFCRREAFFSVGGYPDVPLMEDAEFYRALCRLGRMRQLPPAILASPRRYEQLGPWRTTIFYGLILGLYIAGVRLNTLAAIHARLTCVEDRLPAATLCTSLRESA